MKIGDVVCLKSNPEKPMTIEKTEGNIITCVLINSDGSAKRDSFDSKMIEISNTYSLDIAKSITDTIIDFIKNWE